MAEELQVVEIRDDFYRDSFGKIVFIIMSILVAIGLIATLSIYLYINKPRPVTFAVYSDWRVQQPIPLGEPYLSASDVLQWVNDAVQQAFVLDFYHYNDQLKNAMRFFTPEGWRIFLNQLNIYANYNNVQTNKLFLNAVPGGAPIILQQGLLGSKYAWWVQMPITINYVSHNRFYSRQLTLQVLVVRVPTLNNLNGVGIDNVIVVSGANNQQKTGTV